MRLLSICSLLWFLIIIPFSTRATESSHNVLVIHSYHKEMQWVDEIEQAIEKTLVAAHGTAVDIHVEYMDSKRFSDHDYFNLLSEVWRYKYLANRPDCLIVCDDNALNFILSTRDQLFAGIPIVFCGINHYDAATFARYDNITGVVEAYDLPGTLRLIKRLLPETRDLFIINDTTMTGIANKARIEEISYLFQHEYNFIYAGNLTIDTLRDTVSSLPEHTAILLMSYNRDAEYRTFRYRDAITAIRSSTSRPIFGVWSFYLGRGLLGGSLVNGESQGRTAADLALKILAGTPAASLPVVNESPNLPMFDYRELKRFAIAESLLPEDAVLINTPDNLWYRHRAKVIMVAGLIVGQLCIIFLLFTNIRKRRQSETVLRENRQNLSTTLAAIGEAVVTVNGEGRVIHANPQSLTLFNMKTDQLEAHQFAEIMARADPENGPMLAELVQNCINSGERQELPENATLNLTGRKPVYLSGSCSPIRDPRGGTQGGVLVCHDITEKLQMQNMLAQSRKMEAIGQLAGGVAHDFNNLLTGISGFAEILTFRLPPDSPEHHGASRILQAAARASDLTRKMLSFARKGKMLSSPVDCHHSLQAVVDLLGHSVDRSIRIDTAFQAANATIVGDPTQLENIFLNLAINSADAMADGGILTIATDNVEITEPEQCEFGDTLRPGTYLRARFTDTGCGIPDDIRTQIFEPFFTTKSQGKGTGLGLAAVCGAMKEHEGRLKLDSQEGKGTEFTLYFPLTRQRAIVPLRKQEIPEGDGTTLLVIDDERLILASARELLTELGYNVLLAEGPIAGIDLYRRQKEVIDLVVLDMIMPEMNGTACFKELKKINPQVRALISSGFTRNERVAEAEELGIGGFLQKPYSAAEMSQAIRGVMSARPLEKMAETE